MITQKYFLSAIPDKVKPLVRVSQYDDSSRTIVFIIQDYEEEISSAEIVINENTIQGTVNQKEVSFLLTSDLTENSGIFHGEVRFNNIGTLNFDFEVDSTPLESENVQRLIRTLSRPNLSQIVLENVDLKLEELQPIKIDKTELTEKEIKETVDDVKETEEVIDEEIEEPIEDEPIEETEVTEEITETEDTDEVEDTEEREELNNADELEDL